MNKVIISGKILNIESFKTRQNNFAINLILESYSKYGDMISCVAYGFIAESIIEKLRVSNEVLIVGRLMSIQSRETKILITKLVIEEIGLGIFVRNDIRRDVEKSEVK